ncbi:MAG: hypothetical protein ACM3XZ_10080 [Betaproteobacteria bacterium]
MYRQYNQRAGVSLEQGTPAVPADNRYHLLHLGKLVGSYPSLKRAMNAYRKLVQEILGESSDGSPAGEEGATRKEKKVDPVKESTERFLDAKDAYWANSHKYRRGGRLGRR